MPPASGKGEAMSRSAPTPVAAMNPNGHTPDWRLRGWISPTAPVPTIVFWTHVVCADPPKQLQCKDTMRPSATVASAGPIPSSHGALWAKSACAGVGAETVVGSTARVKKWTSAGPDPAYDRL